MKSYPYSKLALLASLFKFHILWACVHPTSGLNMDQAAYIEQKICIKSNGLNLKANTQKDKKAKYKHKVNQFTSITKQSSPEDNDNTIDQTICAKCSAITLKFNNKNTKKPHVFPQVKQIKLIKNCGISEPKSNNISMPDFYNLSDKQQIRDPMLLDKSTIMALINHGCSKEIITYFLNRGLSINAKNMDGQSLLMYVILNSSVSDRPRNVDFVLRNKYLDINAQDNHGFTVLMLAVYLNDPPLVAKLLSNKNIDIHIRNSPKVIIGSLYRQLPMSTFMHLLCFMDETGNHTAGELVRIAAKCDIDYCNKLKKFEEFNKYALISDLLSKAQSDYKKKHTKQRSLSLTMLNRCF